MNRRNIIIGLGIIIAIAAVISLYFYFAYARYYNFIGEKKLTAPEMSPTIELPGPEGATEKDAVSYLALGDSLTAGVGCDNYRQPFPYLIAERLAQNSPVTLTNLGIPGAVAEDVKKYQLEKAVSLNPDYITLLIGINDIHNGLKAEAFSNVLSEILAELSKTKAKIILINIPFLGAGDILLPPYRGRINKQTELYNEEIKKIAVDNQVCLVDLYAKTKDAFKRDISLYSADHFHPSAAGYQLWSEIIYADSDCFAR